MNRTLKSSFQGALVVLALFVNFPVWAQVEIDRPIELTGTNASDRQVRNLGYPQTGTDGVSAGVAQSGAIWFAPAGGSGGAYTLALSPAPEAYAEGMLVRFRVNHTSPGASTLNVNGLGAVSLTRNGGSPIEAGDLQSGGVYEALFDGVSFQLLTQVGSTSAPVGDFTLSSDKSAVTTAQGAGTAHDVITLTLSYVSGTFRYPDDAISLSASGMPSGVTAIFTPSGGHVVPTFQSALTFSTTPSTPLGSHSILITASVGSASEALSVTLHVGVGKRVFVTQNTWNAALGGLGGGDAKCNTEASSAGLAGTFRAWLSSTSEHARDRVPDAIYVRTDGQLIALSKADLTDGSLLNPIDKTAAGSTVPTIYVWTGTFPNGYNHAYNGWGSFQYNCNNWNNGSACSGPSTCYGSEGHAGTTSSSWTGDGSGTFCNNPKRIYCFQE